MRRNKRHYLFPIRYIRNGFKFVTKRSKTTDLKCGAAAVAAVAAAFFLLFHLESNNLIR